MPSKRKREENVTPSFAPTAKPLSAVAAARLRAEAAVKGVATPELTLQPIPAPLLASVPVSSCESGSSDSDGEQLPVQRSVKLCNWRSDSTDVLSDTSTEMTVNLNKHTTIAALGCFDLKVLKGAVHVNGANIGTVNADGRKDNVYRIYAPATHPIPKIRGLDGVNHVQLLNCETPAPLASINHMFADIWVAESNQTPRHSFAIIPATDTDILARPLLPDLAPEEWLRAVEDCAGDSSITLVMGPSYTGKSVFSKRLINRCLTGMGKGASPKQSVFLLDLNCMKQEYGPPGQISLVQVNSVNLGPAFTHPATGTRHDDKRDTQILRAHPIPVGLEDYMDYLEQCVDDLFLVFKHRHGRDKATPLVIDTSGFLYTSQFAMLLRLLVRFKAHNIVHISDAQTMEVDNAAKLHLLKTTASQYSGVVHDITAQTPMTSLMRSETDLRNMQMQSYFHLAQISRDSQHGTQLVWDGQPISNVIPWEFCYQGTSERQQDMVGFAIYAEPLETASFVHALIGSIVHIVTSTSSSIPAPYTSLPRTSKYQIPYFPADAHAGTVAPLDPRTTSLVCTALVREFDPENKVVRVIVPGVHENLLQDLVPERTVLVGGCSDTPEWAFMESAVAQASVSRGESIGEMGESDAWLESGSALEAMGYINTVRRIRKFQT